MTSVEIQRADILNKLRKKIKQQLGKELSDQEIIEKCLFFSEIHFKELLNEIEGQNLIKWEPYIPLENQVKKKKPLYDSFSGILEDELNLIKKSGKSVKDFIRETWKY